MEFCEQEPVVMIADAGAGPEDACHVFFYGTYHYCGDAGPGYILCCPEEMR
jgi:hypothetical protein